MKFIKEVRETLGLKPYKMSKKMGLKTVQEYIAFEESKWSVNVNKLIKLWELSGLSAESFMELLRQEFTERENNKVRGSRKSRSFVL